MRAYNIILLRSPLPSHWEGRVGVLDVHTHKDGPSFLEGREESETVKETKRVRERSCFQLGIL